MSMKTARKERAELRSALGLCKNDQVRIKVIQNGSEPKLIGKRYYFTTPSGEYCRYPNAYKRKFGKPIYHPSTRTIEIGYYWLMNNCKSWFAYLI